MTMPTCFDHFTVYEGRADGVDRYDIVRICDATTPTVTLTMPTATFEVIRDYVVSGIPTGDFLHAVLSNNLFEAFGRADYQNEKHMKDICSLIYNSCPSQCWGSKEIVESWLDRFAEKDSDTDEHEQK